MNSSDTTKLMAYMASLWPSFKPTKETAAAWSSILGGQDAQRVTKAVADFAINAETAFPPTPQEIFKALRQQSRPERRVAGQARALPAPPEETLSPAESARWFEEVYKHLAWVSAQAELNREEERHRREMLKEAWEMLWKQKEIQIQGWTAKNE